MTIALFVLVFSVLSNTRAPLLPVIGEDLRVTADVASLIIVGYGAGRLVFDIPAGHLADRFSPRLLLGIAAVVLSGSLLWLGLAPTVVNAVMATVVGGLASGLATAVSMTAMVRGVPANARAMSLSVYTTGLHMGGILGPLLGGAAAQVWSWRPALLGAAGVGLLLVLLAARTPTTEPGPWLSTTGAATTERIPRRRLIGISMVPFAVFMVGASLPQTLLPYIAANELGMNVAAIGAGLASGGVARIVGGIVVGWLADRHSRELVIIPCMVMMSVAAAILALPPSVPLWIVSLFLMMFTISIIPAAGALLADNVPREQLGRNMGVFRFIGDLGLMIGPAMAGFMYTHAGRTVAVLALAGTVVVALILFVVLVRDDRAPIRARPLVRR